MISTKNIGVNMINFRDVMQKQFPQVDASANVNINFNPGIEIGQGKILFPTGNEYGQHKIIEYLFKNNDTIPNSCYIGVSCLQNFNMMFASNCQFGILFDLNPCVKIFFDKIFILIKESNTRFEFFKKIINEEKNFIFKNDNKNYTIPQKIFFEFFNEESWLCSDDRYNFIKEIIEKNNIFTITEDMSNKNFINEIKKTLLDNKIQIRSIYTSNVQTYSNTASFIENIADEKTIIVGCLSTLMQSVFNKKEYLKNIKTQQHISIDYDSWQLSLSRISRNDFLKKGDLRESIEDLKNGNYNAYIPACSKTHKISEKN